MPNKSKKSVPIIGENHTSTYLKFLNHFDKMTVSDSKRLHKMPLPQPLENIFRTYFANLNTTPPAPSVLYLLRRDAAQCFGFNPNTYDVTQNPQPVPATYPPVLWPGAMTVFTGIDLLGKFLAGVDEGDARPPGVNNAHPDNWKYSVGGRFNRFAALYLTGNDAAQAELLYQARCAIAHSFSLWARRRQDGQEYSFTLAQQNGAMLLDTRAGALGEIEAIIYLYELHSRFQQGVITFSNDYYARLEANVAEHAVFQGLVDHYGFIGIAQASAFGW